MTPDFLARAAKLLDLCRARDVKLATAESCTGGLVVALLTSVAGSSDVVECGFVTYSNTAKQTALGVSSEVLQNHGAVSKQCAIAMAQGAILHSQATLAVAITGIAGPGGGTTEKPLGLVHFACATKAGATSHRQENFGDIGRDGVRMASVAVAMSMLENQLE